MDDNDNYHKCYYDDDSGGNDDDTADKSENYETRDWLELRAHCPIASMLRKL